MKNKNQDLLAIFSPKWDSCEIYSSHNSIAEHKGFNNVSNRRKLLAQRQHSSTFTGHLNSQSRPSFNFPLL